MDASARASATQTQGATSTNGTGRRGVIELARIAVEDTIRLVQQEIQLAKIEIQEMLKSNIRAAVFLVIAGLLGLLFIVMLLVALVEWVPNHVLAALIVALVLAVIAAILGFAGIKSLKTKPLPKTMTTLKEDAEWAKQVLKRNGK